MLPITGYVDRLSARPGETLDFKIDCRGASRFDARLVRVRCADPNPAGPGIRETELPEVFAGTFPGRRQDCHLGSYIRVPSPSALDHLRSFTVTATVWPTTPQKANQSLLARYDPATGTGFALGLDGNAGLTAVLGGTALATGRSLKRWQWYRVWASYDAETSVLEVGHQALARGARDDACRKTLAGVALPGWSEAGDLFISAQAAKPLPVTTTARSNAPALSTARSAPTPPAISRCRRMPCVSQIGISPSTYRDCARSTSALIAFTAIWSTCPPGP